VGFVCRYWHGTFLRHTVLWPQLYLSKGVGYVKTLLERASALGITTNPVDSVATVTLLPPYTARIKRLCFECGH